MINLARGETGFANSNLALDWVPLKHAVYWSIEMRLSSPVEDAKLTQLTDLGTDA